MNINLIKLVTGEEIVTEVVSQTDTTVTIKNPLLVVMQPGQGGVQFGFLPFASMVNGDVTIEKSKTLYIADVKDDLRNNYSSMFGGIVTPSKQLLI